jgi:adenine-specific DNA-methyltransferase
LLNSTKISNALILDFFAGSGTTLHAVMQLNAEDGGNRQCILVTNNENNIAREVCYERNKRVIAGYTKPNGTAVKGLTNNHLHYMKVDFAVRSGALSAKLDLVRKATDILRLKENCWKEAKNTFYTEGSSKLRLYHNATHYLLIVYDDAYLSDALALIQTLEPLSDLVKKEYIITYVFSDSPHDHREEFAEVLPRMRLSALPEAIYNALRDLLPK